MQLLLVENWCQYPGKEKWNILSSANFCKVVSTYFTHLSLPLDVKFNKVGKLEKRSDVPNTMHYFASIQPNVFSPALTVIAENGNVILESQDWAASMGLKLAHPKYTPSTL